MLGVVDVAFLARVIRVSEDTVVRWIKAGALPAGNVGSDERPRYRIDSEDAVVFLRARGFSDATIRRVRIAGR